MSTSALKPYLICNSMQWNHANHCHPFNKFHNSMQTMSDIIKIPCQDWACLHHKFVEFGHIRRNFVVTAGVEYSILRHNVVYPVMRASDALEPFKYLHGSFMKCWSVEEIQRNLLSANKVSKLLKTSSCDSIRFLDNKILNDIHTLFSTTFLRLFRENEVNISPFWYELLRAYEAQFSVTSSVSK
jgi:hypothetical protein